MGRSSELGNVACTGEMLAYLGFSERISALRDIYQRTTNPYWANDIARNCVLLGREDTDPEASVRLAEVAANGLPVDLKSAALSTLGAALYRAGRFADAVQRLEEGIKRRHGGSDPGDWYFLALAHHRLGHRADATRWLDRLRTTQPVYAFGRVWREFVIQRIRSEAEAVILYDPVFPDDPFAADCWNT